MQSLDQLGAVVDRNLRLARDKRSNVLAVLGQRLSVDRVDFNSVVINQRRGNVIPLRLQDAVCVLDASRHAQ